MKYSRGEAAGMVFLVAATQLALGLVIAEALYPGYSVSDNYVTDLGVGPSSMVFNSSVFLLGVLLLIGVSFLRHMNDFKILNILLAIVGAGAMGVSVFTKNFTIPHVAVSSITFLFAGVSAVTGSRVVKGPLSLLSIALGAMTLGALALFSCGLFESGSWTSDIAYDSFLYLGLGPGGMERMIVYPVLMWLAAFGGYIIARQET